jgi:UTP-glucose-1-phosphate uridylyltransferase
MTEAQQMFDRYAAPACKDQLTAPVLHRALTHPAIASHVLGGKGVGSQGDGTVQFLARDEESREAAITILTDQLGLSCLRLTVARSKKVRKAVITAAGFGTRLFPMTSAVRKEFLPVVDRTGRMLPLILANVEEAASAGIEEICIIVQEQDRRLFEDFFHQNLASTHYEKLSAQARQSLEAIKELGRRVVLHAQEEQNGLGHAVFQVRDWVGNEPFLLVLGDHLFVPRGSSGCAKQLVDRYQEIDAPLIALQPTPAAEIGRFGTVGGVWVDGDDRRDLIQISQFKEKPDREFAAEYLSVEKLDPGTYLTVFGLYILPPGIFEELERGTRESAEDGKEVQLTDAMERLRRQQRFLGLVIQGEKIDVGLPEGYLTGLMKFAGRA